MVTGSEPGGPWRAVRATSKGHEEILRAKEMVRVFSGEVLRRVSNRPGVAGNEAFPEM